MDLLPPQPESRPNPDPTVLTTQQLERMKDVVLREIMTSQQLVESKLVGVEHMLETRMDGVDKAIIQMQQRADRLQANLQIEVEHLKRLHQEKFDCIAIQFKERDTRTEQTSRDSKVALDAAFQAAKEAVGQQNKRDALAVAKSEATFTKQIDQIGVLVASMGKGLDGKIDDIKGRLQAIESTKKGAGNVWAIWFAATGIAIGIGGVLITAASFIFSRMK